MKFWKSPWTLFHGWPAPLRRFRGATQTRPTFETLEDRLALSSAPIGPLPVLSYSAWSSQKFSLETMKVANSSSTPALSVGAQDAGAGQGEGFGSDIGLDKVQANYPYHGSGYSVAIIDTGIDYNNSALGGGWGKRVIAGYNFVTNSADPMDDNGHGTHVAGIIGSSDATYTGIAPNVNFIALKVLDSSGSGTFGAVDQALQWVAAHQAQYHIVAVNMSLGAGNYTANPYTFLENDFTALKSEGVFIAAASGNSFYDVGSQQGLGYPAISPQVVSVGAVWDGNFGAVSWVSGARDNATAADNIASFTQRSASLSILAPGAMITSTYLHNTFKSMAGTSMATPVVAGSAVLLHEALDAQGKSSLANEDYILNLMKSSGVTITDGLHENDNVVNTGLKFQRLDLFAALNAIGPVNHTPPTLAPVPSQTMTAGAPLVINIAATSGNGAPLAFSAQATSAATSTTFNLGQQLGLHFGGSYFLNSLGQNEKWILGSNAQWYCLMPNGDLRRWTGDAAGTLAANSLVANVTSAVYNDPSQFWTAPAATTPPVTLSFNGNTLTVQAGASYLGSFTVVVTASAGGASATTSFVVTVVKGAPVLGAIANQTMTAGVPLLVNLPVSEINGAPFTFSARATSSATSAAFNLGQQLSLRYGGSYFFNSLGQNEKWILGASGQWYCLMPNGDLRHWTGDTPGTLAAGALIGNVTAAVYADPTQLWTPPTQTTPPVTFSFAGNSLTLQVSPSYLGSFTVVVTATAGGVSTNGSFVVTVANRPPVLGAIANQTISHQKSLTINLAASDPDADPLTFSALALASGSQAAPPVTFSVVGKQLVITPAASVTGSFPVEVTLSDGKVSVKQSFSVIVTDTAPVLTAVLDRTLVHGKSLTITLAGTDVDGDKLTFAAQTVANNQQVTPQVTYSVIGNQLTVTPAADFVGTFTVGVIADDGAKTARQLFNVLVTNTAPVLGPQANLTATRNQGGLVVTVPVTDAENDKVTLSAQPVAFNQAAYNLQQQYGFTYYGSYFTSQWGANEKWIKGKDGKAYCILPNGELRQARATMADVLKPDALIATLDPAFYQDPSLIYKAQTPVAPKVTIVAQGNQLTVTPVSGFKGTFYLAVTASDGFTSTTKTYLVTI